MAGGVDATTRRASPAPRSAPRTGTPNLGFFTSGAFIGDYNGLAASTDAVYAVWTDGRNNAIGQTGIGETDIFTNVQKNP